MAETRFKVNPAMVEKYLAGVDYPAKRQDLIDQARANNADSDVMETLAILPDQTYHSPIDVSKAMAGSEGKSGQRSSGGASVSRSTAVSAAEVQKYLRGMDYPAGIREVVNQAQKNGAPGDVIDILERIRDREFKSAADVSKALGEVM